MASIGNPTNGPPGQRNDSNGGPYEPKTMLNTYIHNYFLNEGKIDLAKSLRSSGLPIHHKYATNMSKGNNTNSLDDGDGDSKGDGSSMIPGSSAPETFILDWWLLFWDFSMAANNKLHPDHPVNQYLTQHQQQARMRSQGPGVFPNPNLIRMGVKPGVNDTHFRAVQNNLKNLNSIPNPNARIPQNPIMHRDGPDVDVNGPRAQSPMGDSAPSPKRQRLDGGGLTGPQLSHVSRPPGMPGQFQNGSIPPNTMLIGGAHQKMPNPGFMPNGAHAEMMTSGAQNIRTNGGGGALADYQMQLMLLEQQNKRRLMMARQEQDLQPRQDGVAGPGGLMMPGATTMSHDGSRTGQSPGPADPTKRGTPTMGTNSPRPDGAMQAGRGSPGAANFDQSNMPTVPHPFMPSSLVPPNGPLMRPAGGPQMMHGANGQMFPAAQIEQLRQHPALRGGWPVGPQMPGQMPTGAHMPHQQPQPLPDASQPRNAMPPPSAPSTGNNNSSNNANSNANANNNANNANVNSNSNAARNQTSSPQQPAAPATPSTTSKAAPKKKDTKDSKKKPTKKVPTTTGATPTSTVEGEEGAIPTPQTPVTPQNAHSFNKAGPGQAQTTQSQGPTVQPQNPMAINLMPETGANVNHFGSMDQTNDQPFPMEFGDIGNSNGDVLNDFDFDAFLQMEMDPSIDFDSGFTMNHEVEPGAADA